MIIFEKKNRDEEKDEESKPNNDNKMIHDNTVTIRIMYTTVVALIIGMVLNLFISFSDQNVTGESKTGESKTGESLNLIVNFISSKVGNFQEIWINIFNQIKAPQLLKAFFLFCAGFLIPFFTIFVKVSKDTQHYDVFLPLNFNTDIKSPVYFIFLALMLSCAVTFLAVWLVYTVIYLISGTTSGIFEAITGIVSFILCNVLFNLKYPPKKHVMEYIYILISFCFALLGTPVTFGILYLVAKLANISLVFENKTSIRKSTNVILFSIFVSYWLGIFLGGKKLITNFDKKLQMIIVTIICMTIGMFFAFSGYYIVFTKLLSAIIIIVRTIIKFLGPPAIIALTASQIYLANKSFRHKNRTTDDFN